MKRLIAILGLLWCVSASAAEVIPPAPKLYFNDYANAVSSTTAEQLNQKLSDFEKATSSQVVVAIFPKMESDSSVDDYTLRVARSWKVGQKDNNGAVLFVFVQDHKMFIQVGYGLEGALPDSLAKRIISSEIAPRFKQGDFDGGVTAGVNAILAATKGEYKGTGRTVGGNGSNSSNQPGPGVAVIVFIIFVVIIFLSIASRTSGRGGGWIFFGGGGGWSGGGGGGGGGGGFSGGGGSFGGGGAGGSW